MILTLKPIKISDIDDYLKLLSLKYDHLESRSFAEIASLIRFEFIVDCTTADLERYYEVDKFSEDYELESRRQEHNINY